MSVSFIRLKKYSGTLRSVLAVVGLLLAGIVICCVAVRAEQIQKALEVAYMNSATDALSNRYDLKAGKQSVVIEARENAVKNHGSVIINRREVLRFRSTLGGLSPFLRAKQTANRLAQFLSVSGDPRLIQPILKADGSKASLQAGDVQLAHVDAITAKSSKNTVKELAFVWANAVRQALDTPPLLNGPDGNAISKVNRQTFIDPTQYKITDYKERGLATWYGPGFHGKRTADGSRFNMDDFTAAHRTLPFGTLVRVKSPKNGREVVVRITDRGPYTADRIIDLSRGAAKEIGLIGRGVLPVTLEVMSKDPHFKLPKPAYPKLVEGPKEPQIKALKAKEKEAKKEGKDVKAVTTAIVKKPSVTPSPTIAIQLPKPTKAAPSVQTAAQKVKVLQALEQTPDRVLSEAPATMPPLAIKAVPQPASSCSRPTNTTGTPPNNAGSGGC